MKNPDDLSIEMLEAELIQLADAFIEKHPYGDDDEIYHGARSTEILKTGLHRTVSHGLETVRGVDTREVIRTSEATVFLGKAVSRATVIYDVRHTIGYSPEDGRTGTQFGGDRFRFVVGEANHELADDYWRVVNKVANWLVDTEHTQ